VTDAIGDDRASRIGRNTLVVGLRAVFGAAFGFATGVVIARGLGPDETGVYTLVVWTGIAASIMFCDGLNVTILKFVAQRDVRGERDMIGRIVGFGIRAQVGIVSLGTLLLVLLSGVMADAFNVPGSRELFVVGAAVFAFTSLTSTFAAPLFGVQRPGWLLPLTIVQGLALVSTAAVVLGVLDAGLEELIVVQAIVGLFIAALHLLVLAKVVPIRWTASVPREMKRRMARTAIALTLVSTLGLVVFKRSEVFILGYFSASSDVAYYSIAYAISEALQQMLPMALAVAVFPSVARAFATSDLSFARRAYEGQLRLTALAVFPVAVAGAVLSAPAIDVLYGSEFGSAAIPLVALLVSAGVSSLGSCARNVLVGGNHERLVAWLTALGAACSLGLGFALIPSFGLTGAVAAEVTTQFVFATAVFVAAWRTLGFGIPVAGLFRILAANLPVLISVAVVVERLDSDLAELVVGILIVVPTYALGLWVARALSPFERQYFRERLSRLRFV